MNDICGKNELKRDFFNDDLSCTKSEKGKDLKNWLYNLCIGRGCIGRGCVIYRSQRLRQIPETEGLIILNMNLIIILLRVHKNKGK